MFDARALPRRPGLVLRRMSAALLSVGALLGGCADVTRSLSLDPGGVSADSPLARQAVAASRGNYTAPRLADIPAVPKGLAPASAIKVSVIRMIGERRTLNDVIFALPPAQTDTDLFLTHTRDVLAARPLTPPPEDQPALTAAFADQARAQIQPPPPPAGTPPRP